MAKAAPLVNLVDDDMIDDYDDDEDLKEAIAASLVMCRQQDKPLNSNSPDPVSGDDNDMQQALELSMRTYEAEQQQPHKRCSSPDVGLAGPSAEAEAPAKRQRVEQEPAANADAALMLAVDDLMALSHTPPVVQDSQAQTLQLQQACPDPTSHPSTPDSNSPPGAGLSDAGASQGQQPVQRAGLGRSGSVQNLADAAGGDSEFEPDWQSNVSGVSGAGAGAADANDAEPGEVDQVRPDRGCSSRGVEGQGQQQQRSRLKADLAEVGMRHLYQPRDLVYYTDPVTRVCYSGTIMSVDSEQQQEEADEGHYIVDVQYAAVRYVEATSRQLLPRLAPGDLVWCKPGMADPAQGSVSSHTPQQQQQWLQQRQKQQQWVRQRATDRDPWQLCPWVLGRVHTAKVERGTPVLEVQLIGGDEWAAARVWFPCVHVNLVRERGESSKAAETRHKAQTSPSIGHDGAVL